jgi:hypothetical protein
VSVPQRAGTGEFAPVMMNWSLVQRLFTPSGGAKTKFWKSSLKREEKLSVKVHFRYLYSVLNFETEKYILVCFVL